MSSSIVHQRRSGIPESKSSRHRAGVLCNAPQRADAMSFRRWAPPCRSAHGDPPYGMSRRRTSRHNTADGYSCASSDRLYGYQSDGARWRLSYYQSHGEVGTGERAENSLKPYQALKLYRKRSCNEQKAVPKKCCTKEKERCFEVSIPRSLLLFTRSLLNHTSLVRPTRGECRTPQARGDHIHAGNLYLLPGW